jgi:hypothetical protein
LEIHSNVLEKILSFMQPAHKSKKKTRRTMTRDRVIEEAKKQGKTEVETLAGWTSLDQWKPYGETVHTSVSFYIDGDRIREEMAPNCRQLPMFSGPTQICVGVWPVR